LLIAFLGLTASGIIIKPASGVAVKMGNLMTSDVAISGIGLL